MDEEELLFAPVADILEDISSITENQVVNAEVVNALLEELMDNDDALTDLLLLDQIQQLRDIDDALTLMGRLRDLFHLIQTSRVMRPYDQHFVTDDGSNRVTYENMLIKYPDAIFRSLFRFKHDDIPRLLSALKIPEMLNFNGCITTGLEALLILLRRLSSMCRYQDLTMEFDLLPQFLSQLFNGLCLFIFEKISNLLRTLDHRWLKDRRKLERWAAALQSKGCPLENTFGWGDGTHIPVCKPSFGQRQWYCGHHKTHCFKALVVTTASGIMMCFGPFDGCTHDSQAADIVGLDDLLIQHFSFADGAQFNIFLDPGYRLGQAMVTPFRRRREMTAAELDWNRQMCSGRIAVEWSIGKVKNLWKMISNKKSLKVLMSPVATYFFVAVHLTNIHSIFYGSQVGKYYKWCVNIEIFRQISTSDAG